MFETLESFSNTNDISIDFLTRLLILFTQHKTLFLRRSKEWFESQHLPAYAQTLPEHKLSVQSGEMVSLYKVNLEFFSNSVNFFLQNVEALAPFEMCNVKDSCKSKLSLETLGFL